ncbi:hypothetical protein [Myceligenerans crystallogenes]|uniref:CopC domain-containing protein n=1 Tax=Myceligenerans crystallogenes TaxID=316335 RepID=A0ABN2NM63_9MICO
MRKLTRLGPALALALGLAAGPAAALPAAAHGGEIDVELGTDGGGRISAALTWAGDGHPVEESAVVVVRAVSASGDEAGPVTLVSAPEGVGWYLSEKVLLDEGHWTLTARVKEPGTAKVETEVDVVAPPEAPDDAAPAGSDESGSGDERSGDERSGDDGSADGSSGQEDPGEDAAGPEGAEAGPVAGDGSAQASGEATAGLPGWSGWVLAALVVVGGAVTAVVLRRRAS